MSTTKATTDSSPSAVQRDVMPRDTEWAKQPDFSGEEFVNTLSKPKAQILIERARFDEAWTITITNSEGFVVVGRRWPQSGHKSLREAVAHAVGLAKSNAA